MPVVFPSVEPTARSFTAPKWPTTALVSQSGVTTRRLWGSRPSQAQLSLTFSNIDDASTSAILAAYHNAKGSTVDLTLPSILFNGASGELTNWLNTNSTGSAMLWFFSDEPPTVESVARNRSNVRVGLVAELRLA